MSQCNPTGPARESHHIRLYNAIKGLDEIYKALQSLQDKLNNSPSCEKVKDANEPSYPSLIQVLDEMPDRLLKLGDSCLTIIEQIDNMLF